MRLKAIGCEVFSRELSAAAARAGHVVDLELLPRALHDIPSPRMCARLQEAVDAVDASRYDAIVLGYALCGTGVAGLTARRLPLVLPRAHDCITLFLGSHERYLAYFTEHPGTYFTTSGWIERCGVDGSLVQLAPGIGMSFADLVEKYGEDDARYLWEAMVPGYRRFTYIEMGVEPDDRFERHTREMAGDRGWEFERVRGDLRLIDGLLAGDWDDREFLVVPPGRRIAATHDDGVVGVE